MFSVHSNEFKPQISSTFPILGWQTLPFHVTENPREECDSVARVRP